MVDAKAEKLLDGHDGDNFFSAGDGRILSWLSEARDEGDRINKDDPAYAKIDEMMDYVLGKQLKDGRPSYLPHVVVNRMKKSILSHVSCLTDLRPLFAFKTYNVKFDQQAYLLNRLVQSWWINAFADLDLADCIKYALVAGCGDLLVEYDPRFLQGDTRLIARDPRDTLPIRPSRDRTLQSWMGLTIREARTPASLGAEFPPFKQRFLDMAKGSIMGRIFTRFKRAGAAIVSPSSTLDGLKAESRNPVPGTPEIILYKTFIDDPQVNLSGKTQIMGTPGTNWSYDVPPGHKLYPGKRLIIWTEKFIIYDGPSQYWHGLYPIARMKLESWPWLFLGLSHANDKLPLQDAINTLTNDFLTVFSQAVNRGSIADKNAVPENLWRRFDPRRPNWKMKLNPTMGEGFKMVDPPNLPPWAFQFLGQLISQYDDLSGVANIQQLLTLRQSPAADTIDKYLEAMTPELRLEARMLEVFLREVAEMVKVNIFQFQDKEKRVLILGDAGMTLQDFDFDPGSMVPSMEKPQGWKPNQPPTPDYMPQLDKDLSRIERAKWFHKLFAFHIAPNSILALHAQEQQMKYIQLSRQGLVDVWSLMEVLDIPNYGAPPMIPLPVKDAKPGTDPQTGQPTPPPMEYRTPETITERLIAQQQLGIGQAVSPAGRKSSGSEPPHPETKGDGRQVISES